MKKKMKKNLLLMLVGALILALTMTSCGKTENDNGEKPTEEKTIKIGIAQISDHPSLNTIRDSIVVQLAEEGYVDGKDNVSIKIENGQGEQSNLKTIMQKFSSDKYDIIIAIATPTAQTALGETKEIPIVFSAVTDPIKAKLVKDLEVPGGNVTGVSDMVSATKILDLALLTTPNMKTIGALYTSSETNSLSVMEEFRAYAKEKGIEVIESPVTNSSEIPQGVANLTGKVDAVFSPIDNTVASSISYVVKTLNEAKIPYYVSADSMVADGGLATDGVNYEELGRETGKIAARVLGGENPGKIPVLVMEETKYYINKNTAELIEVEFPIDILKEAINVGN